MSEAESQDRQSNRELLAAEIAREEERPSKLEAEEVELKARIDRLRSDKLCRRDDLKESLQSSYLSSKQEPCRMLSMVKKRGMPLVRLQSFQ